MTCASCAQTVEKVAKKVRGGTQKSAPFEIIGARYQSNYGMCDYHFPLVAISNIENIDYEQFKYEVAPSDI